MNLRDAHAYGGLVLTSVGVGLTWGWIGLAVLGVGLFWLSVRR